MTGLMAVPPEAPMERRVVRAAGLEPARHF